MARKKAAATKSGAKKKRGPKKIVPTVPVEFRPLLEQLIVHLDDCAKGIPLEPWAAAAHREILRRLIDPPKARFTPKQNHKFTAALCYHIRRELGVPRSGNQRSGALAVTAEEFGIPDESLDTYASKWKQHAMAWIRRVTEGDGTAAHLSREQILRLELAGILSFKKNTP